MAKVSGFRLSGKFGALVLCNRGTGTFARQWVRPKDPKTASQQDRRHRFEAAVAARCALPELEKDELRKRARRDGRTGYHLFLAEFLRKESTTRRMQETPALSSGCGRSTMSG